MQNFFVPLRRIVSHWRDSWLTFCGNLIEFGDHAEQPLQCLENLENVHSMEGSHPEYIEEQEINC